MLSPVYLARLWWRGRVEPLYRHALAERLGRYEAQPSGHGDAFVWVHAVSLGETRAAASLLNALRERETNLRLLLTHGTATGRQAGLALLREGDVQAWLPYDTPAVVRRFFSHFKPALGVLMETEVWPNLILGAQAAGVPMALANARLSERSLRKALRLDVVLRPAAQALNIVLAQSVQDADRLSTCGARNIAVCGNLKFDMTPAPELLATGKAWRARLSSRNVILLAASREGEEAELLLRWMHLKPSALLVIVPRHPQRFDEVATLVREQGLALVRRSEFTPESYHEVVDTALQADVWLGDSMGEMPMYYALADVALLGGSFAALGGQNLIEACACACPLVLGPHTFNFAEAATLALDAGAALRVRDLEQGLPTALELCAAPVRRQAMSQAALDFAGAHRGASARMADALLALKRDAHKPRAHAV